MIVEGFGSIKVQDFRQFIVPEETIKKEKGFEKLEGSRRSGGCLYGRRTLGEKNPIDIMIVLIRLVFLTIFSLNIISIFFPPYDY